MRDWTKAFRPASFRGVAFEVEAEEGEGGRRVAVSDIAYSDDHVTEDMGGVVARYPLTAYVVGDAADGRARALAAALNAPGPSILVLPMLGPKMVRVESQSLSRDLRRAGYVSFDITFVDAGLAKAPFAAVPGALAIAGLLSTGGSILQAALGQALRSAGSGALNAAVASLGGALGLIEIVGQAAALPADKAGDLADAIQAVRLVDTSTNAAGSLPDAIAGIVPALALIADNGDPDLTEGALRDAAVLNGSDPVALSVMAALAIAWCQALASVNYLSRQDARRARDLISLVVDPVLDALASGLDVSVSEWLGEAAAVAASELSDVAANRAPLVQVRTDASLPATLLAYQLYADAGRAGEIVTRNAVATPALMPVAFEALQP